MTTRKDEPVQERHMRLVKKYLGQRPPSDGQSEKDIIQKTYKFLRTEEDDDDESWENRMAKRYWDKLFKEYCLADMTRYKEGKIGLRWRTQKEVVEGRGHFTCGNKVCTNTEDLMSWEVNFAYQERGERLNALVKLRLCPDCTPKLSNRKPPRKERGKKRRRGSDDEEGGGGEYQNGEEEERQDRHTREEAYLDSLFI
ncbi:hypothetical protein PROFUN_01838 [Planoprotostelium fungivorum]|uniref:Protein FRA10AC1 n=1 Tax=Planoprotostelium fungivorum TaxID=1890364 RepID=A0A2P6NYX5_9EUKA|nr:hypothetical protein PROFUN_01838 [Planoprotostelium fungivorum]